MVLGYPHDELEKPPHILVGGWATPLKNMKVNWDDDIPNIWDNKKCSKPPTSYVCHPTQNCCGGWTITSWSTWWKNGYAKQKRCESVGSSWTFCGTGNPSISNPNLPLRKRVFLVATAKKMEWKVTTILGGFSQLLSCLFSLFNPFMALNKSYVPQASPASPALAASRGPKPRNPSWRHGLFWGCGCGWSNGDGQSPVKFEELRRHSRTRNIYQISRANRAMVAPKSQEMDICLYTYSAWKSISLRWFQAAFIAQNGPGCIRDPG